MSLRINDTAPDFTAETTQGPINFHEWIGDGWALLFSHPKDFTPVCTTELGAAAALQGEFAARNCKIIGISVDGVSDHVEWSKDIEASQGHAVGYPLIGDPHRCGGSRCCSAQRGAGPPPPGAEPGPVSKLLRTHNHVQLYPARLRILNEFST